MTPGGKPAAPKQGKRQICLCTCTSPIPHAVGPLGAPGVALVLEPRASVTPGERSVDHTPTSLQDLYVVLESKLRYQGKCDPHWGLQASPGLQKLGSAHLSPDLLTQLTLPAPHLTVTLPCSPALPGVSPWSSRAASPLAAISSGGLSTSLVSPTCEVLLPYSPPGSSGRCGILPVSALLDTTLGSRQIGSPMAGRVLWHCMMCGV